ncbi:DUF2252 family protein [Rhizobium sp. Rhizsp42]|uniref:DUF2252 family protein n=1 Tax=Rhizobium sp. Rhizsp42 TaxID=3243034 RepID=UPI0039AFD8A4
MAGIVQSTQAYESWLRGQLGADLVEGDLLRKHMKMRSSSFSFLRATYWRFSETILDICPDAAAAPKVLAIGDTHLENFGTWRDVEGRLVWGANDFDDAAVMPYALDLIRLTASALLAVTEGGPPAQTIAASVLTGYLRALQTPAPIILERDHKWLRKALTLPDSERRAFWDKFAGLAPGEKPASSAYAGALDASLPPGHAAYFPKPRTAGTGSLGRPRFIAYTDWRGGPVLREAKAMLQSAWSLAHAPDDRAIHAVEIATSNMRSPDPHYRLIGSVLVRRLSPSSTKIEIDGNSDLLLSPDMLDLMGFEIGNCHANDPAAADAILRDLKARKPGWLVEDAKAAAAQIGAEQKTWSHAS